MGATIEARPRPVKPRWYGVPAAALVAGLLVLGVVGPAVAQPSWFGGPGHGLDASDPRAARDAQRRSLSVWIGASARDGDVRDIAVQPWSYDWGREVFTGLSHSHRLARFWRDFTLDAEIGGGYRFGDTDSPEAWGAFYIRYDGFPWRDRFYTAFGLSTGLHWLDTLPEAETGPPERPEPNRSKWLHYFSPEIVFSLPDAPRDEVAIRYHHRSGFFGNMNGVWEGSNVLMLSWRRRY